MSKQSPEAVVKAAIGADHIRIDDAIHSAWARYETIPQDIRGDMSVITQAGMIHCLIVAEMPKQFYDRPDIVMNEDRGLHTLVFQACSIQVRFNKLDENLRRSTNSTQQSILWDTGPQQRLPGVGKPFEKLTVGYLLDASGTQIEDILMVKMNDGGLDWAYSVHDEALKQILTPAKTAAAPAAGTKTATPAKTRTRIAAKKTASTKKSKNGANQP